MSTDTHTEINGRKVHTRVERYGQKSTKSRVFVTLKDEDLKLQRPADSIPGEDEANDMAWDAFNSLEKKTMKKIALETLAELGITDVKLSFSMKAGCTMCSCSPGFVADRLIPGNGVVWIG